MYWLKNSHLDFLNRCRNWAGVIAISIGVIACQGVQVTPIDKAQKPAAAGAQIPPAAKAVEASRPEAPAAHIDPISEPEPIQAPGETRPEQSPAESPPAPEPESIPPIPAPTLTVMGVNIEPLSGGGESGIKQTYQVTINGLVDNGARYRIAIGAPASDNFQLRENACENPDLTAHQNTCTFSMRYTGSTALSDSDLSRNPTTNITVTATKVGASDAASTIMQSVTLRALPDPLGAGIVAYSGPSTADDLFFARANHEYNYRTATGIRQRGEAPDGASTSYRVAAYAYPFAVPLIQTYSPSDTLFDTPLAMRTRCGNSLVYFVIQKKITNDDLQSAVRAQESDTGDHVTVKYHALISDGVTSGVTGSQRVATGRYSLFQNRGDSLSASSPLTKDINAHISEDSQGVWSGHDNEAILRELITTDTVPENDYIISKLTDIRLTTNQNPSINSDPFIDTVNHGAKTIITVHSLLTPDTYDTLRDYLSTHHSAGDVAALLAPNNGSHDRILQESLRLYRQQVTKACAVA